MGTEDERGVVKEEGEEKLVKERMVMDKLLSTPRLFTILRSLILLRLRIPFPILHQTLTIRNLLPLFNLYLLQFLSLPFRTSRTPI